MAEQYTHMTDEEIETLNAAIALRSSDPEQAVGELFTESLVDLMLRGLRPARCSGLVIPFGKKGGTQ